MRHKILSNRKPQASSAKSGFTMVELSLAMAFIAMLLIAIAIIATSLVSIYQKGLSIKTVNGVGRNLIDEFVSGINTAPSVDTTSLCNSLVSGTTEIQDCVDNHANKFIFQEQRSVQDANGNSEQYNGIFCTGYYSYIWNTKAGLNQTPQHTISVRYLADDGSTTRTLDKPRLARIVDKTYRLCSAVVDNSYQSTYPNSTTPAGNTVIDITELAGGNGLPNPIPDPTSDYLRMFDTDLLLGDLTIFPISQDKVTLRTFFSGTFILTTVRGNVEILNSGDYCDPNGARDVDAAGNTNTSSNQLTLGSEFNYCAINKFNFAARTAGSGV